MIDLILNNKTSTGIAMSLVEIITYWLFIFVIFLFSLAVLYTAARLVAVAWYRTKQEYDPLSPHIDSKKPKKDPSVHNVKDEELQNGH